MNINSSDLQSKLIVYRSAHVQEKGLHAANTQNANVAISSQDRVALSERWRSIADAQQAMAFIPDVRELLVSAIQTDLHSGTYMIDNQKVAEGILRESMVNQAAMM